MPVDINSQQSSALIGTVTILKQNVKTPNPRVSFTTLPLIAPDSLINLSPTDLNLIHPDLFLSSSS